MRQLYPLAATHVDPFDVYPRLGRTDSGRPSVRANMISSADGAAHLDERTVGLSEAADRALFATLRSLAGVILVGAATARLENYGPARVAPELSIRRAEAGMTPTPPIAVVTRTCRLDWGSRLFTEPGERTIVITTEAAAEGDREHAARVADVVVAGHTDVAMGEALASLGERGFDNVLAEGGPTVLAQLAACDLVDELCLTIAPLLVPGPAGRILSGRDPAPALPLQLRHVLEADGGYLFLAYDRPTH
jgi:riboflavin biosynthesis pyrimidine reductase